MVASTLFTAVLLLLTAVPVNTAVSKHHLEDDVSCVSTTTITLTETVGHGTNTASDEPEPTGTGSLEAETVTVKMADTLTVVQTLHRPSPGSSSPNGTSTTNGGDGNDHGNGDGNSVAVHETLTITSNVTVTETETETSYLTVSVLPPKTGPTRSTSAPAGTSAYWSIQPPFSNNTQAPAHGNSSLPASNTTYYPPTISATHSSTAWSSATASPKNSTLTLHSGESLTGPSTVSLSQTFSTLSSPVTPPSGSFSSSPSSGYENSLFFTNWGIYGANYHPQSLPASQITRVYYAFANFAGDGTVSSSDIYADLQKHYITDSWDENGKNAYGCVKQLFLLKKKNRKLKVILSIGGWNASPGFPAMAASATARQAFASSAVRLVTDWGFDGIDIDWEYPSDSDGVADFVSLLHEVRAQLDAWASQNSPGYHFLLTVDTSAGPAHYGVLNFTGIDAYVDTWNVMTYDFAGSWDNTTGHQANLYLDPANLMATKFSTDKAISDYLASGIPPQKILLGLPVYGRAFESTAGLGLPYNGVGEGSSILQTAGLWLYKELPRSGATELYDDTAKASYSYDSSTAELITYDNVKSAVEKSAYLRQKGLGGAFFWEARGDKTGAQSLVATVANELGSLNNQTNLLSYPTSQYDNIRNGLPGL